MRRIGFCSSLAACAALLLCWGATISTAQNIIRDMRAKDIAQTPVLGRGFSLATNSYQSLCMKDVQLTEPSYDFDYSFKELSISGSYQPGATAAEADFSWFIAERMALGAPVTERAMTPEEKAEADKQKANANSLRVIDTVKIFMGVKINVLTYYASVDESKTKLAPDAVKLLDRNDVPGFFQACGTYYVRGINRESKYEAVFEQDEKVPKGADAAAIENIKNKAAEGLRQDAMGMGSGRGVDDTKYTCAKAADGYRTKIGSQGTGLRFPLCFSQPRYTHEYVDNDQDFNCRKLEKHCFDEGGRLATMEHMEAWLNMGNGGPAAYAVTSSYDNDENHFLFNNNGSGEYVKPNNCHKKNRYFVCATKAARDTAFAKKSSIAQKKITIRFKGTGLTHDKNTNLVAFTMDEFKAAIKGAYTMMQNPLAGRVQSTEIVPWTENVAVQKHLKMETKEFINGKEVPLFRKKDILTANGEYLAEMHRALRLRQGRYYLSRNCESQIDATNHADWMVLKNHVEAGLPGKTVGTMQNIFRRDKMSDGLWKDYMTFLDQYEVCAESILLGDQSKLSQITNFRTEMKETKETGKNTKLRQLERGKAIFLWRWSDYEECKSLKLAPQSPKNWVWIEQCCMPEIWGPPSRMENNPIFKQFIEQKEYQAALRKDPNSTASLARKKAAEDKKNQGGEGGGGE